MAYGFGALEGTGIGLTPDDIVYIRQRIDGYKSNNILYRIKNMFFSIIGQSDWQIATRFVIKKIIQNKLGEAYEHASFFEKTRYQMGAYRLAMEILHYEITPDCLVHAPFFSPYSFQKWTALQT